MDHSYRAVNGNVADGPPSTIPTSGNGHGSGYYPDVYSAQPPAPIREDAPTRIFCFIEDLFFLAKIQETARKLGVKVEFVKGENKDAVARIIDAPESEKPALLVFDLNNLNAKPMALIPKFKGKFKKAVSIIGFLNHLQGDLKMKAIEAGCDVGHAALGLLAEPAHPSAPLRRGRRRRSTRSSRRCKGREQGEQEGRNAMTSPIEVRDSFLVAAFGLYSLFLVPTPCLSIPAARSSAARPAGAGADGPRSGRRLRRYSRRPVAVRQPFSRAISAAAHSR